MVSTSFLGGHHARLQRRRHQDATPSRLRWSHLLRDFTRISQRAGLAARIGRGLLGAGYVLFRWRGQDRSADRFEPLCRRVKRLLMHPTDRSAASMHQRPDYTETVIARAKRDCVWPENGQN